MCGGSFVRTVPLRSQVNTASDEFAVQNNWTKEPVAMLTAELAVKKPAGRAEVMVATWPLAAEGMEGKLNNPGSKPKTFQACNRGHEFVLTCRHVEGKQGYDNGATGHTWRRCKRLYRPILTKICELANLAYIATHGIGVVLRDQNRATQKQHTCCYAHTCYSVLLMLAATPSDRQLDGVPRTQTSRLLLSYYSSRSHGTVVCTTTCKGRNYCRPRDPASWQKMAALCRMIVRELRQ